MAEPLNGLNDEVGDVLVLASALIGYAMGEDDFRAGAAHDEALDDFTSVSRLLELCIAGCVVLVVELGSELDVDGVLSRRR